MQVSGQFSMRVNGVLPCLHAHTPSLRFWPGLHMLSLFEGCDSLLLCIQSQFD